MMEKYRHDNIVEFIGAVKTPGKQTIVTELCQYGSLLDVIRQHKERFSDLLRIKCLLDGSRAMEYLHGNENGITHRDLKPENILIVSLNFRDRVVAKVSDFGSARVAGHGKTHVTRSVGTPDYMPPEILELSETYDDSVDVYSFSMLTYTVFSGISPVEDSVFAGSKNPYKMIISGYRPSVPPSCPEDIAKLMKLCWHGTPSRRPKFAQIHAFFEDYFLKCRYGSEEGAKAAKMAEQLLNKMPQIETEEELIWTLGGGTDFEQLCELLKANAISTMRLELKGIIGIHCEIWRENGNAII